MLIWLFRNTEFDGFYSNILGQPAKQEVLVHPPMLLTQFYLPNHWYRIYTGEMKINMFEKEKNKLTNNQNQSNKTQIQPTLTELDPDDRYPVGETMSSKLNYFLSDAY